MKYRKKPIEIEAVQFNGLNPTEIKNFVGDNCEVEIYDNKVTPPVAHIVIHTLEGDMRVSKGDYVIKGVQGEYYPCRPDIFEQTYQGIEDSSEGLDEAAKAYALDTADDSEQYFARYLGYKDGAKWQKEQDDKELSEKIAAAYQLGVKDKEQKFVEGLDEAIKSYVTPRLDKEYVAYGEHRQKQLSKFDAYDLEAAIEFGAEWAFGQGEYAEGRIIGYDDGSFELVVSWLDIPNRSIFKDGDKVIVQIRKK